MFKTIKYKTDLVFTLVFALLAIFATTALSTALDILIVWILISTREIKMHIDKSKES